MPPQKGMKPGSGGIFTLFGWGERNYCGESRPIIEKIGFI